MPTCAMMGQAAGFAAAITLQRNTEIKKLDLLEIRQKVEQNGAVL